MDGEPVITVAVSDALARIEAKVDSINTQLVSKADTTLVHEMDLRLRAAETTLAALQAAHSAVEQAKGRQWVALGVIAGLLASACAVFGLLLDHMHVH